MADAAELGRKFFRAIQDSDIDGACALLSDDVDFSSPGGAFKGSTEVRPFLQGYVEGFPGASFEIRNVVEAGQNAALEGAYIGTHSGPLRGPTGDIPATGKSVSLPFVSVFESDGERITAHRSYWDQMGFMAQLGLMPEGA
jgi:steroid delta-isomerase-like uncharacterized protein